MNPVATILTLTSATDASLNWSDCRRAAIELNSDVNGHWTKDVAYVTTSARARCVAYTLTRDICPLAAMTSTGPCVLMFCANEISQKWMAPGRYLIARPAFAVLMCIARVAGTRRAATITSVVVSDAHVANTPAAYRTGGMRNHSNDAPSRMPAAFAALPNIAPSAYRPVAWKTVPYTPPTTASSVLPARNRNTHHVLPSRWRANDGTCTTPETSNAMTTRPPTPTNTKSDITSESTDENRCSSPLACAIANRLPT